MSDAILTTEQRIARARAALSGGADAAALIDLDGVAHEEPGYADVHNLRGLCLSKLGRLEEALLAFDAAIAINTRYIDAHLNRAVALDRLGRTADAEAAVVEAETAASEKQDQRYPARLGNRLANSHAELGDLYAAEGFLAEATDQYRRACAIRPGFVDIRNRLGCVLVELGLLEGAVRELTAALAVRPEYAEARANLGRALHRTGRSEAAGVGGGT